MNNFSLIANGKELNLLYGVDFGGLWDAWDDSSPVFEREGVSLSAPNSLNAKSLKVLDILLNGLSHRMRDIKKLKGLDEVYRNGSIERLRHINISIKNYMDMVGSTNRQEAVRDLKRQLVILSGIKIKYIGNAPFSKKKQPTERLCSLADCISEFVNGDLMFSFSMSLMQYVADCCLMPFPNRLFRVDLKKYKYAYALGRRLAEHFGMNRNKLNAGTLSMKSIIKRIDDVIPDGYSNREEGRGGHFKRDVLNVFNKNMNHLVDIGVLLEWRYAKGEPKNMREFKNNSVYFAFYEG